MSRKHNISVAQQLQYRDHVISYSLIYADRKTVSIEVHPDQSVDVRVPVGMDQAALTEIILKRVQWILRSQEKMAQRAQKPAPSRPAQGETIRFLGRYVPLKVVKLGDAGSAKEEVKVEKRHLTVSVKDTKDKARVQALIDKWYREQAETIFLRRMLTLLPRFQYLRQLPQLTIRRMKSRWGSCGTNGVITLNLKLIQVDEALLDYVLVHELCHLIEHNHSKNYYALLSRMMPDWQERRQRLNEEEIEG